MDFEPIRFTRINTRLLALMATLLSGYACAQGIDLEKYGGFAASTESRAKLIGNTSTLTKADFDNVISIQTSPAASITWIELESDSLVLDVGDTISVQATAYAQDGTPITTAPVTVYANNPAHFSVEDNRTVQALRPGAEYLIARSGNVFSDPLQILVNDPNTLDTGLVRGRIVFPDGFVPSRPQLIGPSAEVVPIAADGSFSVSAYRQRNGLFMVIDDNHSAPLLTAYLPALDSQASDQTFTIDVRSTAEALLYMYPGAFSPRADALHLYRSVAEDNSALPVLTNTIEQLLLQRGDWSQSPQLLEAPLIEALDELTASVDSILSDSTFAPAETGAQARGEFTGSTLSSQSSSDVSLFRPTASPGYTSGLQIELKPVGESKAVDITVRNRFHRHVALFLEKVPETGARDTINETAIELRIVGATNGLPTLGMLADALLEGGLGLVGGDGFEQFNNPLMSPSTTQFNTINLDPITGGAEHWRIFAYSLGLQGALYPEGEQDSPELWLRRAVPATALTAAVDVLGPFLDVLGATGNQDLTVKSIQGAIAVAANSEGLYRVLGQGDGDLGARSEFYSSLLDTMISLVLQNIKDAFSFKSAAEITGKRAALAALSYYSTFVSMVQFQQANSHIYSSRSVDMIDIFDAHAQIEPRDFQLPEIAEIGCEYEAQWQVVGSQPPFQWAVHGAPGLFSRHTDERSLTLAWDEFPAGPPPLFKVEVSRRTEEGKLEWVAEGFYKIYTKEPSAKIDSFEFPIGPQVMPGDLLPITVVASHCEGAHQLKSAEVDGLSITAPVQLTADPVSPGQTERAFSGDVVLKYPVQDRPVDLDVERLQVRVKTAKATLDDRAQFDVINVKVDHVFSKTRKYEVAPGESFQPEVIVHDANMDLAQKPRELSLQNPEDLNGLSTSPKLSATPYAGPTRGDLEGEARFKLAIPITIKLGQRDNDGPSANDKPYTFAVKVMEPIAGKAPLKPVVFDNVFDLVVKNVDPKILGIVATSLQPAGNGLRPLSIEVTVSDDNGASDIGGVQVDLSNLGLGTQAASGAVFNPNSTTRRFVLDTLVPADVDCVSGCLIGASARDKDDDKSFAKPASAYVMEHDEPPEITAIGHLANKLKICPGDPLEFEVIARDMNLERLQASLRYNGLEFPMTETSFDVNLGRSTFHRAHVAPGSPGVYVYEYEVRDRQHVVHSKLLSFSVSSCQLPPITYFGIDSPAASIDRQPLDIIFQQPN